MRRKKNNNLLSEKNSLRWISLITNDEWTLCRIAFVSVLPAYKNKLAGLKIESEKYQNFRVVFVSLFTLAGFAKQFLVGLFAEKETGPKHFAV